MIVQDRDPRDFLKFAGPLLYKDEVDYCMMLGLVLDLFAAKAPPDFPPIFLRYVDGLNQTQMAFVQTRPQGGMVTQGQPLWLSEMAHFIRESDLPQSRIFGPTAAATVFAREYCQTAGRKPLQTMTANLMRLEQVVMPRKNIGEMMFVQPNGIDQAVEWIIDFEAEATPHERRNAIAIRKRAEEFIANKSLFSWVTTNLGVVSMAATGRETKNISLISTVYTPTEFRGRGYASCLVAKLSQFLLDQGKTSVLLYADKANPTSGKIYERLGFRNYSEACSISFEPI